MENLSSGKPDSIDRPTPNLLSSALPYPSNVAMCYPAQPSLNSPLSDGSQAAGTYLVPPSMTSPSSCLSTQPMGQMYPNAYGPSPYYRSMLAGSQQSGYSYSAILPHHSFHPNSFFYNPNSPSVYPGSGQPTLNPMNYYSPSLYMQNHEISWSNNNATNSQTALEKRPFSYDTNSSVIELPSCGQASSSSTVPETMASVAEEPSPSLLPLPEALAECLPERQEPRPSAVSTTEARENEHEFDCQPLSTRSDSNAETTEELLNESIAKEESHPGSDEEVEQHEEEDLGEEEEEIAEYEDEEDDGSTSYTSSYTESYSSDDLLPIDNDDDGVLEHNMPHSILNDTFGDMDHSKEDMLVDDELQCLLCNNFDHLIPRLDIAIKLEPVVGEKISKSSVLLCTQCDLMLERYLSLEKEVHHLQTQIQSMYQNNKQVGNPDDKPVDVCAMASAASRQEDVGLDGPHLDPSFPPVPLQQPLAGEVSTAETTEAARLSINPVEPLRNPHSSDEGGGSELSKESAPSVLYDSRPKQQSLVEAASLKSSDFECQICNKCFATRSALVTHGRVHTRDKTAMRTGPVQCQECSLEFERRSVYLYHVRVHHGSRQFKCNVCGKDFVTQGALSTHERVHTGEKPFKCRTCDRGFNVKSNLLAHVPKCTSQLPFKCADCGKAFGSPSLFKAHQKAHQGEFAVKCDICNMGFLKRSHLIAHQRTHTKEKPFECLVCGKTFASIGNRNSHAKTHTDERKFVCEICGAKFARKQALETHLNRHKGTKPYKCDSCGKSFYDASNLVNHKKTHRNPKTATRVAIEMAT